jgi:hypothetical protein
VQIPRGDITTSFFDGRSLISPPSTKGTRSEKHGQPVAGTDGKHGDWLHGRAGNQSQLVAVCHHREQELPLQQRKAIANAQVWSPAKGEIGAVDSRSRMIGGETLGIKDLRLLQYAGWR